MYPHRFLSTMFALLLLTGCSGERKPAPAVPPAGSGAPPSATQPGISISENGSLRIEPEEVYRGTSVRLSGTDSLPAGATFEWLVNGKIAQTGGGPTMDTSQLRKGDSIQVRAAGSGGTVLSQPVKVRNSPPGIGWARFVLGDGPQGSAIGVEAETHDPDGDTVQVEIAWRKNGEPAGAGNRLAATVKRGDKVDVTITPFDGEERGRSATIYREIRNIPPVIDGQERFQVGGNVVTFHVRATDADGDSLEYSIKDAPAGMQIDRTNGWVRWETPAGTTGKIPFAVTVSDGSGGEATARFTVTIAEQSPPGPR